MDLYLPWVALVMDREGFSATPYQCPAGVWTIGFGHTGPDVTGKSARITREQGEALLKHDMGEAMAQAFEVSPVLYATSGPRQAAVADFCFNVGPHKYATSTLRKRVDGGQWALAALENAKWVYGGGKKLPGLITRRAVTSKWLREG